MKYKVLRGQNKFSTQFSPKYLTLFQVIHLSPEMSCPLVPIILFFHFYPYFLFLLLQENNGKTRCLYQWKLQKQHAVKERNWNKSYFSIQKCHCFKERMIKICIVYHLTTTKLKYKDNYQIWNGRGRLGDREQST